LHPHKINGDGMEKIEMDEHELWLSLSKVPLE